MSRRTLDALSILAAGILVLTGQGILLAPHLMGDLLRSIPSNVYNAAGLLLFLFGLLSATPAAFESYRASSILAHAFAALALAALGALYASAGFLFETPLLVGASLTLLLVALFQRRNGSVWKDTLTLFSMMMNAIVGALLLTADRLPLAESSQLFASTRTPLAGLFLGSVFTSLIAHLLSNPKLKQALSALAALPWIAWIILPVSTAPFVNAIPAVCFATTLTVANLIPWPQLKLPDDDLLGRRLILLASVVQTTFLIGFTFLLKTIGNPRTAEATQGALTFYEGRELILTLNLGMEVVIGYALVSLIASIHELTRRMDIQPPAAEEELGESLQHWRERINRLTRPFATSQSDSQRRLELQTQQAAAFSKQLEKEKRRTAQLTLLSEFSQQLETQLDAPVAAQLAVNTLQKSLHCSFTALYLNDAERRELVALAAAGTRTNILPPGYRQAINAGVLGRTMRLRKTQVVSDVARDPDYFRVQDEETKSLVVVPLIDHGHLKGLLEVSDARQNAFSGHDVQITEAVAAELLRAWERSEYHQRLTELIQAGISLTTQPDPQAAVQEVASIARHTLRARFTYVTLLDQEGNFTRSAFTGNAPRLLKSLNQNAAEEALMQAALNADRPFRIRDLRKYKRASHVELDYPGLRSVIAIPIRVHRLSVGAMLAFGKQGEVFFTENDESLASLLSSQAAAAIESAWLSQELRTNLYTTTQLYNLSFQVIQAQGLTEAVAYIAETAHKLSGASAAGILLYAPNGSVEAEVQLDEQGNKISGNHPNELIRRAMESQQSIFLSADHGVSNVCFPLKTHLRTYGALWLTVPENRGPRYATNLQTLANQAAVALERSILLVESRMQANQLEEAYQELEITYDRTLEALMSALDARDRETEGHSTRVANFARLLGERLRLPASQLKALERGSLLHDIGKIGISDTILHKPGPLSESEWRIMRRHPDIGARIVADIPFLQDTLAVVRYHQERWDGSGYPLGLSGKDIPTLARIFAVVDAFDALTSNRPYRSQISHEDALAYLRENAGVLFDPEIVAMLTEMANEGLHPSFGTEA
jgi:HD-GYP domain-containing protein (c-di-GMP phosphodiesterase class II)/putative methionine-R-sulfoxide reductase with GAF domain